MSIYQRTTWAEISLARLEQNYRSIKDCLTPGTGLMAVVKANAYGHGAIECARALESAGADWFGVALVEEGIALREASIKRPIFCVAGFCQGQAEDVVRHQIVPAVFRIDTAEELNARAREAGRKVKFHLKIDTGIGRLGVPFADAPEFVRALKRFDHLHLDGLMTHFADAGGETTDYTEMQIARFNETLAMLRLEGFNPSVRHLASSTGLHAYPHSHGNLVRAGATLYGLTDDVLTRRIAPLNVEPVMSLHSRIVLLKTVPPGTSLGYGRTFTTERESRIGTISIGYGDGWQRALSNKGRVIVRNGFAPIVGRVSMDLTIIDVTDVRGAALGDEVVLIGEHNGLRIKAEDVAKQIGTISYEVVTGIQARVPRVFSTLDARLR